MIKLPISSAAAALLIAAAYTGYASSEQEQQLSQSPLSAYPGFGHNADADEIQYLLEEAERERLVEGCMRTAGFRYNAAPSVDANEPLIKPKNSSKSSSLIDQNERYAQTLSPENRQKYYLALYGVPDPNDPQKLWNPESDSGGGCSGAAIRAVPGVFAARGKLGEQFATMLAEIRKDARVVAVEAEWAGCMRGMKGKGFTVSNPGEVHRLRDLRAAGDKMPVLPGIEAASASCMSTTNLPAVVEYVRIEHEAAFVQRNKATLDATGTR